MQVSTWTKQYQAAATDSIKSMDDVAQWLSNNTPEASTETGNKTLDIPQVLAGNLQLLVCMLIIGFPILTYECSHVSEQNFA